MLVLSRKSGESVCVGQGIEVKVIEISGNRVRLGFSAPRNVDIQRQEIRDARCGQLELLARMPSAGEVCAIV